MDDDPLISVVAAAVILGVDRRTVSNWARYGRFPVFRDATGRDRAPLRFRRSDILTYKTQRDDKPVTVPVAVDPEEAVNGDLITTMQAAALLAVNRATVLNWAQQGRFPAIKYGEGGTNGIYRFQRSDIVAYLERSRVVIAPPGAGPSGDPDA